MKEKEALKKDNYAILLKMKGNKMIEKKIKLKGLR